MSTHSAAVASFRSLVADFGYDEVISELMDEYKTVPEAELGAVEALLDVALVDLLKAGEGGDELRRAIAQ
jgi:hypothetical protein